MPAPPSTSNNSTSSNTPVVVEVSTESLSPQSPQQQVVEVQKRTTTEVKKSNATSSSSTTSGSCSCSQQQESKMKIINENQNQNNKKNKYSKKVNNDNNNNNNNNETINVPMFHRKDFRLGHCLGKGSFSKVYTISRTRKMKNLLEQNDHNNDGAESTVSSSTKSLSLSSSSSSSSSNKKRLCFFLNHNNDTTKTTITTTVTTKKKFAMKLLRQSTIGKSDKYARAAARDIINEVKLLSLFHHENIINVYGFCPHESYPNTGPEKADIKSFDQIFLIIDKLKATIEDKIFHWQCQLLTDKVDININDSRTIPMYDPYLESKVDIALQVADALHYLHSNHHIYRDLKPQNIGFLIKKSYDPITNKMKESLQVKIFDFGVCRKLPKPVVQAKKENNHNHDDDGKAIEEELYKLSFVGSPRYMAPEVHNKQLYNTKADVYSWALVVYNMLTLSKPYAQYSASQHKKAVCINAERPSFDPLITDTYTIPMGLQNIITNAWEHKIKKRSSMIQIITELKRYYNYTFGNCKNDKFTTTKTATKGTTTTSGELDQIIKNNNNDNQTPQRQLPTRTNTASSTLLNHLCSEHEEEEEEEHSHAISI